jgi:capsular polysaccharide biosynthesis protein
MHRPPEINVSRSVKLHMTLAICVAVCAFLLGAAALFKIYKNSYTAHAVIYVSPVYPHILASDQMIPRPNDSFVDDQIQMLKQTDVLADALRKVPEGVWRQKGESIESAADRLSKTLKVERIQTSSQIQIELSASDAHTASTVLNAITTAFVERSHKEEFYGSDEHLKSLYSERDHLTSDLQAQIEEKTGLLNKLGVASVNENETNAYNVKLGKLQLDLLDAEQKHSQSEAQLNSVERVDDSTQSAALDAEAEEVAMIDPGLASYKTSLNARRSQLLTLMAGLTPQHPSYKQAADELKQIDASLSDMTHTLKVRAAGRLQDKLRAQVMKDRLVEGKIRNQVAEATTMANVAAPRMEEANAISSAITRLEGRLSLVDERIANLELQNSSPGSVHLSQVAIPPEHADPSKARKLAFLLLPVCLFLGVFAAVARDLTEPYVWNGGDVRRLLGFDPVAVLPMRHLVADGFYREQLFRLAGGMERAIQGTSVQTVLMAPVRSSVNTGEILEQIAREMSRLGLRIVIVDSQQGERALAYPAIHDAGEDARQKPVELALTPTKKGRLGTVLDAATEFSDDADAVLLEGAPLLLSAESEYLARMADATVLVVVAGETRRHDLLRAVRLLERIRAGSVAVVVAESDLKHADYAYRADANAYVSSPVWPSPVYAPHVGPGVVEYVEEAPGQTYSEPSVVEYVEEKVTAQHAETTRPEATYPHKIADPEVRVLLDRRGMLERRAEQDRRVVPDRRVRQIAVLFDRRANKDRRGQSSRRMQPQSEEPRPVQPLQSKPVAEERRLPAFFKERASLPERRNPAATPRRISEENDVLDTRWVKPTEGFETSDIASETGQHAVWYPMDFPPPENWWTRPVQEPPPNTSAGSASREPALESPIIFLPEQSAPMNREPEQLQPARKPFASDYVRSSPVEAKPQESLACPASEPHAQQELSKQAPAESGPEESDRGRLLSWIIDDTETRRNGDTQYGNTPKDLPLLGSKKPKNHHT